MAAGPAGIAGWTGEHLRHAATLVRQGRNPAARVYESIGADSFLALSPGWLNLGLWEGQGLADEAEAACRRLVRTLASALPDQGGGVPQVLTRPPGNPGRPRCHPRPDHAEAERSPGQPAVS